MIHTPFHQITMGNSAAQVNTRTQRCMYQCLLLLVSWNQTDELTQEGSHRKHIYLILLERIIQL